MRLWWRKAHRRDAWLVSPSPWWRSRDGTDQGWTTLWGGPRLHPGRSCRPGSPRIRWQRRQRGAGERRSAPSDPTSFENPGLSQNKQKRWKVCKRRRKRKHLFSTRVQRSSPATFNPEENKLVDQKATWKLAAATWENAENERDSRQQEVEFVLSVSHYWDSPSDTIHSRLGNMHSCMLQSINVAENDTVFSWSFKT